MTTRFLRWILPAAACLLAACASPWGARPAPPPGTVSVTHTDPARFSETRVNPGESTDARQQWLDALSLHLAERAAVLLPPGQRLEVEITDVRRAGNVEPWRGPQGGDVRIVRDLYPPRIDLDFRRLDADGRVLQQGRRELRDQAFLLRPGAASGDALRHEKQLIDDWLQREFGALR